MIIHTPSSHAGTVYDACVRPLVATNAMLRPEPPRLLDEKARAGVGFLIASPNGSEESRMRSLVNHWTSARLQSYDDAHRTLVHQYAYHIAKESIQGHARDESLERVVRVPALKSSVVHVVGEIDRLESQILDLEVAGLLPRREVLRTRRLSRLYRESVLRAEWEFLSSLPPEFVRAETERISRLRLPRRDFTFVKSLLRAPFKSRRAYRRSQGPGVFTSGRLITWTLTDVPENKGGDMNRAALRALYNEWLQVDERVRRIHARAEKLRALAQMDGVRAADAAVDPVGAGHRLRRQALEDEWKALQNWTERTRESALIMLEQFTLDERVKARLRTAILSSREPLEDYLRQPNNRRRATKAWAD